MSYSNTYDIDGSLKIPHWQAEELFGLRDLTVSDERAYGSMRWGPWLHENDGRFAMGSLGVLADNVLAQAVLSYRPTDMWAVTTELSLDFFTTPNSGEDLTAESRVLALDAGGGSALGQISDESGNVVASSTFWGRFIEGVPEVVSQQVRASEVVERPSSLGELLDLADGPSGQKLLQETNQILNPLGAMHGGVLIAAVEQAAVQCGVRPAGMVTAAMRMSYLRPALGDVWLSVKQIHRGRSFASAEVTSLRKDGKAAMRALLTFRSTKR